MPRLTASFPTEQLGEAGTGSWAKGPAYTSIVAASTPIHHLWLAGRRADWPGGCQLLTTDLVHHPCDMLAYIRLLEHMKLPYPESQTIGPSRAILPTLTNYNFKGCRQRSLPALPGDARDKT